MVYPYYGHPSWTNHRCEKLAQSFYAVVPGRDPNPRPLDRESDAVPRHHDATVVAVTVVTLKAVILFQIVNISNVFTAKTSG